MKNKKTMTMLMMKKQIADVSDEQVEEAQVETVQKIYNLYILYSIVFFNVIMEYEQRILVAFFLRVTVRQSDTDNKPYTFTQVHSHTFLDSIQCVLSHWKTCVNWLRCSRIVSSASLFSFNTLYFSFIIMYCYCQIQLFQLYYYIWNINIVCCKAKKKIHTICWNVAIS